MDHPNAYVSAVYKFDGTSNYSSPRHKNLYVFEVLIVHMNGIYKNLTTIKWNKIKFNKVYKKIIFSFSKVNFSLLEKKILLKKWIFKIIFVHINVQNFRNIEFIVSIRWKDFRFASLSQCWTSEVDLLPLHQRRFTMGTVPSRIFRGLGHEHNHVQMHINKNETVLRDSYQSAFCRAPSKTYFWQKEVKYRRKIHLWCSKF